MSEFILRIRDLTIDAKNARILDKVSLDVRPGQITGIIGESGAGKSTLALASMGFFRPGSRVAGGSIRLADQELVGGGEALANKVRNEVVTYVAQSAAAAFNPAQRIGAQVMEVPVLRGIVSRKDAAAQAASLFAKMRLPDPQNFGSRYPHQTSGGQLQRAMIAMALANRPRLIVFDEPTTALDATTQLEVLRTIKDVLADRTTAALYISHDLALVSQVADRIVVLRNGSMVEENDAETLINAPQQPYTAALVAHGIKEPVQRPVTTGKPLLEAVNVVSRYGRHVAVDHVSFTVRSGRVTALVGESGSGKSTVTRSLLGLLPPASGSFLYRGKELPARVSERSSELRRSIQLIHQQPDLALNPRHTIGDTIGRPIRFFFGETGNALRKKVEALLSAVELPTAMIDRYPGSLSGGQKQRICIARALAAEPNLLVCDEVTSALDPLVEEAIIGLLSRLRVERELSMLFITHDLGLAARFADEVAVMNAGRVVEAGEIQSIFDEPKQAYTRKLLSAVPTFKRGWLDSKLLEDVGA